MDACQYSDIVSEKEGMSYNIYLAGGVEIVWIEILKSKGMMIGNYYETIWPR